MGLLRQLIEKDELFGSFEYASGGIVSWECNQHLKSYSESQEIDREDLAYCVVQAIKYFKDKLGLSLSTIERFHVKNITEDAIKRVKIDFQDLVQLGTFPITDDAVRSAIWLHLLNRIKPGEIHLEVVQRMMIEIYCVPIEIMRDYETTTQIPRCELDYLARLQHRLNNPFTAEDYQK